MLRAGRHPRWAPRRRQRLARALSRRPRARADPHPAHRPSTSDRTDLKPPGADTTARSPAHRTRRSRRDENWPLPLSAHKPSPCPAGSGKHTRPTRATALVAPLGDQKRRHADARTSTTQLRPAPRRRCARYRIAEKPDSRAAPLHHCSWAQGSASKRSRSDRLVRLLVEPSSRPETTCLTTSRLAPRALPRVGDHASRARLGDPTVSA